MFSTPCLKNEKGKTIAFLLNDCLTFKLKEKDREEAFRIVGSQIGRHIYDSDRTMNEWISIPFSQSETWKDLTRKALKSSMKNLI